MTQEVRVETLRREIPVQDTRPLAQALTELGIQPFTRETVTAYKKEMLQEVTKLHEFAEKFGRSGYEFEELRKWGMRFDINDAENFCIRFWRNSFYPPLCTVAWWERTLAYKRPIMYLFGGEDKLNTIPDFAQSKASEIKDRVPDAEFYTESLQDTKYHYDPFLIVRFGDEEYYIEAWMEPGFERVNCY